MEHIREHAQEHTNNGDQSSTTVGDSVFLSSRALGFVASGFLLTVFFAFISGYFIGKRVAVSEFVDIVEHETLQAKVHDAVLAMYHHYTLPEPIKAQEEEKEGDLVACSSGSIAAESAEATMIAEVAGAANNETAFADHTASTHAPLHEPREPESLYVAQLASFRLQAEAAALTKKLSLRGIESQLKKRTSLAAGTKKKVTWYQVVTKPQHDKRALELLAQKLEKEEKLRGIFIYSCS